MRVTCGVGKRSKRGRSNEIRETIAWGDLKEEINKSYKSVRVNCVPQCGVVNAEGQAQAKVMRMSEQWSQKNESNSEHSGVKKPENKGEQQSEVKGSSVVRGIWPGTPARPMREPPRAQVSEQKAPASEPRLARVHSGINPHLGVQLWTRTLPTEGPCSKRLSQRHST